MQTRSFSGARSTAGLMALGLATALTATTPSTAQTERPAATVTFAGAGIIYGEPQPIAE